MNKFIMGILLLISFNQFVIAEETATLETEELTITKYVITSNSKHPHGLVLQFKRTFPTTQWCNSFSMTDIIRPVGNTYKDAVHFVDLDIISTTNNCNTTEEKEITVSSAKIYFEFNAAGKATFLLPKYYYFEVLSLD